MKKPNLAADTEALMNLLATHGSAWVLGLVESHFDVLADLAAGDGLAPDVVDGLAAMRDKIGGLVVDAETADKTYEDAETARVAR